MKYMDKEFKASYVIAPKEVEVKGLAQYRTSVIGDYILYHSEEVYANQYSNEDGQALLVGYCFDIRDGEASQKDIVENLLSSDDIVEELDYINGRYFIVVTAAGKTTLFSDASQLQPLVYHKESGLLSSHDALLASILESIGHLLTRRPEENHSELDFTRYEEIYKLNPSLSLTLSSFTFQRIYPRYALGSSASHEVFLKMKPFLDTSAAWLANQNKDIFLTITAGIDSRVSAALTRRHRSKVEYLTYYTPRKYLATNMARTIHKIDKNVAEQMKENMGWNHSIINIRDFNPSQSEFNEWSDIYNSRHAYGLIKYYRNHKNYSHALHIKSTVFGMGKADYKKNLDKHEDSFHFYKKCIHGLPKSFNEHYDIEEELDAYFERNLIYEGVAQGRHYFDLFHLESRMGNWHSTLTLETDPEVDEFIFMNTRKMIDMMQEPSTEERRKFSLYKEIVNEYWPVLLHFGINNEKNMYEQSSTSVESTEEHQQNIEVEGVTITPANQMTIEESGMNKVVIKPGVNHTNVYDMNSFVIKNKGKSMRTIRLKSFYSNPKGKGIIKVMVRTSKVHEVYDILSLNEPLDLELQESPYSITVLYNDSYTRNSWIEAGRLEIEVIKDV